MSTSHICLPLESVYVTDIENFCSKMFVILANKFFSRKTFFALPMIFKFIRLKRYISTTKLIG